MGDVSVGGYGPRWTHAGRRGQNQLGALWRGAEPSSRARWERGTVLAHQSFSQGWISLQKPVFPDPRPRYPEICLCSLGISGVGTGALSCSLFFPAPFRVEVGELLSCLPSCPLRPPPRAVTAAQGGQCRSSPGLYPRSQTSSAHHDHPQRRGGKHHKENPREAGSGKGWHP